MSTKYLETNFQLLLPDAKAWYVSHLRMQIKRLEIAGVETAYRMIDDGAETTIVCAGGLGGTHLIWSDLVRALRERYRLIIWDYPGLDPEDSVPDDLPVDVPSLARYLSGLLAAEGVTEAHFAGWSLGVQVTLEYARSHADQLKSLIAVCGVAGEPFAGFAQGSRIRSAAAFKRSLPDALGWLTKRLEKIDNLRGVLRNIEKPTRWAKRFGFVDPVVDEVFFDAVIRDFLTLDPEFYARYALAAAQHDASDLLGGLGFPVLAVAGERDRFIKPDRVEQMAADIPRAEYFEVRGATHFLPLEYGHLLSLKVDEFLAGVDAK
jgi:pimeloyl-ACP methyl ester carboxylesterase